MKKLFLVLLCVGFVAFSLSGNASALSYGTIQYEIRPDDDPANGTVYSGEYLFTVTDPDNDNPVNWSEDQKADLIGLINQEIDPDILGLDYYGKYDFDDAQFDDGGVEFDVTGTDASYTGTWSTIDGTLIEFYTVKAANEWALYWIEGGASFGDWSTEHLLTPPNNNGESNIPTVSHLTLWNADTVIPEPSTVFLLGIGLLGFLGLGCKIKK